jgi:hypothetical protein|nr:MAG TPA: hypothetical protein [Caudoviricetes sp.]
MKLSIKHILPHTYLSFTKEDFIKEDFIFILDLVTSKTLYSCDVDVIGIIAAIEECISKPEVILIVVKIADARNIDVIGILE